MHTCSGRGISSERVLSSNLLEPLWINEDVFPKKIFLFQNLIVRFHCDTFPQASVGILSISSEHVQLLLFICHNTALVYCLVKFDSSDKWSNHYSMQDLLGFVRTNCPTSAKHGDGLGYIRIWATPPRRLVFWDGAPNPYKWYQSHAPYLVLCVGGVRSPQGARRGR